MYRIAAVWLLLVPSTALANFSGSDDFSTDLGQVYWEVYNRFQPAQFIVSEGQYQYTTDGTFPTAARGWIGSYGSFDQDWSVRVRAHVGDYAGSLRLHVQKHLDLGNYLFAKLDYREANRYVAWGTFDDGDLDTIYEYAYPTSSDDVVLGIELFHPH